MPSKRIKALRSERSRHAAKHTKNSPVSSAPNRSTIGSEFDTSSVAPDIETASDADRGRLLFIADCHRQNILLEGLIASVVISKPSVMQVYLKDEARLRFYDRRGDVHSMVSIMRGWCNSLQAQRITREIPYHAHNKKSLRTWCEVNEIDERGLKVIETLVEAEHKWFISIYPEALSKQLRFNKDAEAVSHSLYEIIFTHFVSTLAVYRGHPRLGYHEITTNKDIAISDDSFASLLNRPPWFVLVLNRTEAEIENEPETKNKCKKWKASNVEGKILMRLRECEVRETILTKTGLSTQQIKSQYSFKKLKIIEVGLHCGSKLHNSLMTYADPELNIYMVYNSNNRSLICYTKSLSKRTVKSEIMSELAKIRAKLKKKICDFSYPFTHSSIRARISSGFDCLDLLDENKYNRLKVFKRKEVESLIDGRKRLQNVPLKTLQFETTEDLDKYVSKTSEDLLDKYLVYSARNSLQFKGPVVADREIIVKCTWADRAEAATAKPITPERIRICIERLLINNSIEVSSANCSREGGTRIEISESPCRESQFDVVLLFPNAICARRATDALIGLSKTNEQFTLENIIGIEAELKTLTYTVEPKVFSAIGFLVKEKLEQLKLREKTVEQYCIIETSLGGVWKIELIATRAHHVVNIDNALAAILQPQTWKISCNLRSYLQTCEGKSFVKLLSQLTGVYFVIPEYSRPILLYGTSAGKETVMKYLQEISKSFRAEDVEGGTDRARWYWINFSDTDKYLAQAMINWFKEFHGNDLNSPDKNSFVKDWHLDVSDFLLWIRCETKKDFVNYLDSIRSVIRREYKGVSLCPEAAAADDDDDPWLDNNEEPLNIFELFQGETEEMEPQENQEPREPQELQEHQEPQESTIIEQLGGDIEPTVELNPKTHHPLPFSDADTEEEDVQWLDRVRTGDLVCNCCYSNFTSEEDRKRYVAEMCGHNLCLTCIENTFQGVVQTSRLPLNFPCCSSGVTMQDLRVTLPLVREATLDKLLKAAVKKFVCPRIDEYRQCTRTDCPGVCRVVDNPAGLERKHLICLYCSGKLCLDCTGRYHGFSACDRKSSAEVWMMADTGSRKYCPRCRMGIEKVDGCNNVFCITCQHYTCWTCNKFSSVNATDVYAHLTAEHGGY